MINIAFIGNPNVGKTALINKISNASLKIGNWPGVTIEKKEVFFKIDNDEIKLIDLPGIYNLSVSTPEERIVKTFLMEENIDVIINVIDSTSIERNLYLTSLLKEMGKPMILALNFSDEFQKLNYIIDIEKFQKQIGIQGVFTSGRTGAGIDELMKKAVSLAKKQETQKHIPYRITFDNDIEEEIENIRKKIIENEKYKEVIKRYFPDWLAIKILEGDTNLLATIKQKFGVDLSENTAEYGKRLIKKYNMEISDLLARARYGAVRGIVSGNLQRGSRNKFELTDKIDKVLLNKFGGGIAFLLIIYSMFIIIFDGSAPFIDWVDGFFSDFIMKYVGKLIEGVPDWLYSFIIDGVIAGVGSVLTFVPLMFFIYFFMAVLEECGYMARVAFILNRMMTKVGLSGKAFIPMLVGFGCTVPAIYATRTLEDEKTRRLTGVISTFMSCGARLPVFSLLAVAFFNKNAALVVVSIYVIGVLTALMAAFILKRFDYFKGDNTELLIELPPYRLPGFKVVWNSMKNKTLSYVKKATTVILGILLIIWFLTYFPNNNDTETSYLGQAAKVIQPIFKPTGFGDRWEPVASIVPSIIAKETVVGFLGQVLLTAQEEEQETEYDFGADLKDQIVGLKDAVIDSVKSLGNISKFKIDTLTMSDEETLDEDAGGNIIPAIRSLWNDELGAIRAYSFMLYVLMVVPCAVALGALKQEFGWKIVVFQIISLLILPYIASVVFFNFARLLF